MFGISDPGFDPDQDQDQDRLVGRVMSMQYNLGVQHHGGWRATSPGDIFSQMLGQWLANRYNR